MLKLLYDKEYLGWNLYYDTLKAIEKALEKGDAFALALKNKAEEIIRGCYLSF